MQSNSNVRFTPFCIEHNMPLFSDNKESHNPRRAQKTAASSNINKAVMFDDEIAFPNGISVILYRKIAEGGFGNVYIARKSREREKSKGKSKLYALKRIHCLTQDAVSHCKKEAKVHHKLQDHTHLMPLLGITFVFEQKQKHQQEPFIFLPQICYMLFPYIPLSLSTDISSRHLLDDVLERKRRPYSSHEVLILFSGIVQAVHTMYQLNISHRDIKVDNIVLHKASTAAASGSKRQKRRVLTPVLMDFGSVGPLKCPLSTWADIVHVTEEAKLHTTLVWRAPELCGGGLSYGPSEYLDYGKADVWSLGCVLFAMMYGASPCEVE